jgi:hypothetical protein
MHEFGPIMSKATLDKIQRQHLFIVFDMKLDAVHILKEHSILPTTQRVAESPPHKPANRVWTGRQKNLLLLSQATGYNTRNPFVGKELHQALSPAPALTLFNSHREDHSPFINKNIDWIYNISRNQVKGSNCA